ncbi:EutN/CcmL family microcompartment protein (plasmid) [Mycobacterium sp. TJFP1]
MATVLGPVWATKRLDAFPAGALLEVQRDHSNERYVALDHLGGGPGDHVLVALGSAVSQYLPSNSPADALIVGVIDSPRNTSIAQPQERPTHE